MTKLRDVRASLDQYVASSQRIIILLARRWQASSPKEAERFRDEAARHAANDAGLKFIAVTHELDQLLNVVAQIAADLQKQADRHVRIASAVTVGVSIGLAGLVLLL